MSLAALHTIEIQLILHFCDRHSFLALARCSRHTLIAASAPFAARHLLLSLDLNSKQPERVASPSLGERVRRFFSRPAAAPAPSPPPRSMSQLLLGSRVLRHWPMSIRLESAWRVELLNRATQNGPSPSPESAVDAADTQHIDALVQVAARIVKLDVGLFFPPKTRERMAAESHFPSLTELHISALSEQFQGWLLLLPKHSPLLRTLQVQGEWERVSEYLWTVQPLQHLTSLRLDVTDTFGRLAVCGGPVIDALAGCQHLRHLMLRDVSAPFLHRLFTAAPSLHRLESLELLLCGKQGPPAIEQVEVEGAEQLQALRDGLLLAHADWLRHMTALHTLRLDMCHQLGAFLNALLQCPKALPRLRHLHICRGVDEEVGHDDILLRPGSQLLLRVLVILPLLRITLQRYNADVAYPSPDMRSMETCVESYADEIRAKRVVLCVSARVGILEPKTYYCPACRRWARERPYSHACTRCGVMRA